MSVLRTAVTTATEEPTFDWDRDGLAWCPRCLLLGSSRGKTASGTHTHGKLLEVTLEEATKVGKVMEKEDA